MGDREAPASRHSWRNGGLVIPAMGANIAPCSMVREPIFMGLDRYRRRWGFSMFSFFILRHKVVAESCGVLSPPAGPELEEPLI